MIIVRECALETIDARSALMVDGVKVYTEITESAWTGAYHFFKRATALPGYRGLVALVDHQVVGTGFGYRAEQRFGNWWYDKVAEQLSEDSPVLRDAWQLVTINVLPAYRDMSIVTALHDTLLQTQPCARAVLSVAVNNSTARKFYEQMGWEYAHPNLILKTGEPHHVVMYKSVRG
jgi:ribosomal protein S18 acetylase RimI-like enzyme